MLVTGVAMLLVAFGFKVAAVPFHMWTPDVYEGAPTTVTALMAVAVKAAAFAAFVRVFLHAFEGLRGDWSTLLWVIAALTMTVGNVLALAQRNMKRMLAYSSIAHAGYILVALVASGAAGGAAALFYLLVYSFMTLGAFGVVAAFGSVGEPNETLDDYAGLGFRRPLLGVTMTIFMLSLTGIPPLAGFAGKLYIFTAAIREGYYVLAVIGVLEQRHLRRLLHPRLDRDVSDARGRGARARRAPALPPHVDRAVGRPDGGGRRVPGALDAARAARISLALIAPSWSERSLRYGESRALGGSESAGEIASPRSFPASSRRSATRDTGSLPRRPERSRFLSAFRTAARPGRGGARSPPGVRAASPRAGRSHREALPR